MKVDRREWEWLPDKVSKGFPINVWLRMLMYGCTLSGFWCDHILSPAGGIHLLLLPHLTHYWVKMFSSILLDMESFIKMHDFWFTRKGKVSWEISWKWVTSTHPLLVRWFWCSTCTAGLTSVWAACKLCQTLSKKTHMRCNAALTLRRAGVLKKCTSTGTFTTWRTWQMS